MSFKGILQRRTQEGVWVDVMPFVGTRSYLAVAHASKLLGVPVRVKEMKEMKEPEPGGGGAA